MKTVTPALGALLAVLVSCTPFTVQAPVLLALNLSTQPRLPLKLREPIPEAAIPKLARDLDADFDIALGRNAPPAARQSTAPAGVGAAQ